MKEVPLSEIKDDLSRFLRKSEKQEIVITRHDKLAGLLIGLESEENWFDYPRGKRSQLFRSHEQARRGLQAGRAMRLEDIEHD